MAPCGRPCLQRWRLGQVQRRRRRRRRQRAPLPPLSTRGRWRALSSPPTGGAAAERAQLPHLRRASRGRRWRIQARGASTAATGGGGRRSVFWVGFFITPLINCSMIRARERELGGRGSGGGSGTTVGTSCKQRTLVPLFISVVAGLCFLGVFCVVWGLGEVKWGEWSGESAAFRGLVLLGMLMMLALCCSP